MSPYNLAVFIYIKNIDGLMREKIVKGCTALGVRQLVSLPLNAAGLGIASIFLSPADFGILAVITVMTSLAFIVIDSGTTSALVQNKIAPSEHLLRQVQRSKLGAAFVCILAYFVFSPRIADYYHLSHGMVILFTSCALIAWLQSQRGYQSIWLQRQVEWQMLARVEMLEIVFYNIVLIISAYVIRSPASFVISLGGRLALGAMLLKYFSRNRNLNSVGCTFRDLLKFGVPYQATTALSMFQKALNPIIVGSVLGVSAVGFVNWSNYIVSLPLLPLQPLQAFLFSVVSERQRQRQDDNEIIQVLVRVGLVLISFFSLLFILLLPFVVTHIFGGRWEGAVPVASVLLLGNTVSFHSSVITTHLTAKGHSKTWMQIVIAESFLIWVIGVLGIVSFGLVGYAWGLLGAGVIILAIQGFYVNDLTGLNVKIFDSIRLLIISVLSISISFFCLRVLSFDMSIVWVWHIFISVGAYIFMLFITDFKRLRQDLATINMIVNVSYR